MATLIKGIPVILYQRTQTGVNRFKEPVYSETPTTVENVLVTPADSSAVAEELQLTGRHLAYELCIPKGDSHHWEDCIVEFFGKKWRVFGGVPEYIEALVPLDWNRKVKVERYE